jgi:cyclic 2,3-diphosphoglycerate synthetase
VNVVSDHARPRAIALIDGDHHPSAVRHALDRLADRAILQGVVFCGGEEKLAPDVLARTQEHYGRPVVVERDRLAALHRLATEVPSDVVVDLADEPVLGAADKLEIAAVALALDLRYEGADFVLEPPRYADVRFHGPQLAVIGTGKRTGKTAVGVHWARLLREAGRRPVVVAMGRGGPTEPTLAAPTTELDDLLAISRSGAHAASDYLEHAALASVPAVGCRRVGGGLAGACAESNVQAGGELAASLDPGVILYEGSGAALPPVSVDRTLCVVGSREGALSYLGPYRLLRADLAVVTADDPKLAHDSRRWCRGSVIQVALEPEPAEPVPEAGRVAFFSTGAGAPSGVEPVVVSRNLASRPRLHDDLAHARSERCDVYLTELKAAAVDTVAEAAASAGARLVFVRNRPRELPGEQPLDAALLELAEVARDIA